MRTLPLSALLIALILPLDAGPETSAHAPSPSVKALALDPDLDWLDAAERLEARGLAPEEIYEALLARFAFAQDEDNLIATYAEWRRRGIELSVGPGHLFSTEAERDGFLAALAARRAEQWQDIAGLRRHAREAFTLNPKAFALFDLEARLREAWDKVPDPSSHRELALDTALESLDGDRLSLGSLLQGKKGLYLDFWASWCGPCIRAMPELKDRAERYAPQGLGVAGVNTDRQDPQQKAAQTQDRFGLGHLPWLIEPQSEPISGPLNISSIPRVVLLGPDGSVRFNGHPDDAELKLALLDLGIAP